MRIYFSSCLLAPEISAGLATVDFTYFWRGKSENGESCQESLL